MNYDYITIKKNDDLREPNGLPILFIFQWYKLNISHSHGGLTRHIREDNRVFEL